MKPPILRRFINFWPPLLFNAISATHISEDFRQVEVAIKLRWFNRNYVGSHFGGNLFAMTDPWYMLMLIHNLGREYFVWDKSASIDFIAPGRGTVTARFVLSEETLAEIRINTVAGEKYLPKFVVEIVDENKNIVARVHKTLYVKLKNSKS